MDKANLNATCTCTCSSYYYIGNAYTKVPVQMPRPWLLPLLLVSSHAFSPSTRCARAPLPSCARAAPLRADAEIDAGFDRDSIELDILLYELENLRDWVSKDVALAAITAVQEKRSLDAFISELQDEVSVAGAEIDGDLDIVAQFLDEQSAALAKEKREALADRAKVLLDELEAAAPLSFKNRNADAEPPIKSRYLPREASIIVAGVASAFGESLVKGLSSCGYNVTVGPKTCPPGCADATLPASSSLRRAFASADALVLVCSGAADGGVSPTYVAGASRVLPPTLRRVLLVAPRGVDRTFELGFALRNVAGGLCLDRQRAAEQAMGSAANAIGAVTSVMRLELERGAPAPLARRARPSTDAGESGRGADSAALGARALGVEIAAGDVLAGPVSAAVAARAAREALRREEAENCRFSLGAGRNGDWSDEFLKLVGPEIGRFASPATATTDEMVGWVRAWVRALPKATDAKNASIVLSSCATLDLPTRSASAAAKSVADAQALPTGARIRFLASGVEYVDSDEDQRVKGDFDGAIDVLVEEGRVRVVRAEMEPVWRRSKTEGRKQFTPLVKGASEARLLRRLAADLEAFAGEMLRNPHTVQSLASGVSEGATVR